MRTRSPIFAEAVEKYHACRREYGDYLEAAYAKAETDLNGVLLNARGKREGVEAFDLFKGSDARAFFYASEELVEYWKTHRRMTYAAFERTWFDRSFGNQDEVPF